METQHLDLRLGLQHFSPHNHRGRPEFLTYRSHQGLRRTTRQRAHSCARGLSMFARDVCVKKTFRIARTVETPKSQQSKKARKRPRCGRDGYTTQSISRSIDRQSKPNRSGWCLCSLLSVGVVWLSTSFNQSTERSVARRVRLLFQAVFSYPL